MTERELLNGFGYYPLVRRDDDRIVGHCGLARLEETGEIEVGYLLNRPYWGFGYATEIADRIVGVAFPENHRSIAVMQRVGMHRVGPAQHFGVTLEKYAIRR
jgi:ribosomal-protein-alanine N-acetyltransferase